MTPATPHPLPCYASGVVWLAIVVVVVVLCGVAECLRRWLERRRLARLAEYQRTGRIAALRPDDPVPGIRREILFGSGATPKVTVEHGSDGAMHFTAELLPGWTPCHDVGCPCEHCEVPRS